MILKDFINEYIEGNSLVRVLYKNPGGHKLILDDWDGVSMDWEIVKGVGKYAPYVNHKVLGIASILTFGHYRESINIVIEEIPLNELRGNKLDSIL